MSDAPAGAQPAAPRAQYGRMLRFFVPLALQSASQSLSFLLVASIVAHGHLREQELAAYAQGQSIIWILGSIGGGLITTCMVFGRSRTGMANYLRLNAFLMAAAVALELLCCVPPLDGAVFGGLLGEKAWIARRTLLFCIPMQATFFLRNPYLAQLLVEKRSGAANLATLARIGLALALLAVVVACGMVFLVVRVFPSTRVGKKLSLDTDLKESRADDQSLAALKGAEGVADTQLRPAGFATIGGRRVDVVTRGDEIPAGTPVRVVEIEGNRVVVARK